MPITELNVIRTAIIRLIRINLKAINRPGLHRLVLQNTPKDNCSVSLQILSDGIENANQITIIKGDVDGTISEKM